MSICMEALFNKHISRDREFANKSFHVSDMGLCKRMRILKRMNADHKSHDLRTLRLFAIGHLHHEYLQDILEKEGVLEGKEITIKFPEVDFVGHCDALVKFEGKYYLYEFKNVHSRKLLYSDTSEQYVLQGLTYIMGLEKQMGIKIEELRLVLISRDDMLIKETAHKLTKEYAEQISNEMFELNQLYINKKLPEELSTTDKNNWLCSYCGYIDHCPNAKTRINGKKKKEVV